MAALWGPAAAAVTADNAAMRQRFALSAENDSFYLQSTGKSSLTVQLCLFVCLWACLDLTLTRLIIIRCFLRPHISVYQVIDLSEDSLLLCVEVSHSYVECCSIDVRMGVNVNMNVAEWHVLRSGHLSTSSMRVVVLLTMLGFKLDDLTLSEACVFTQWPP